MSTAAKGDETVREDVLWSEATADSVTAETRALLDDNPFERPQYSLRPQTHDQLARVRAAANPSSSQKNPGSTPSKPYALPTKDSRRSTEERNWARALLLCSEDWAGCAVNEKNFDAAIKFFIADWKERHRDGRDDPSTSFIVNKLLPLWRSETEREPTPQLTRVADTKTDTMAYKGFVCRLADGSELPDLLADTTAPLASVKLPLTEEALRLHSALMTPTAELIDASGHHGSIASSMASSSSASSSDGVENVTLCPRLNQCIYVKEIPEDQAVAAKDEASRFISRGDLDYMVQLTHVIPKRPSNGPLVFALRSRLFLISAAVPLSWHLNHASNLIPLHLETHISFNAHLISLMPQLSTLKHMEQVLIDYENGGKEPWRRWLEDKDFRAQCVPLRLEIVKLAERVTLLRPSSSTPPTDGTYRLRPGGKKLPPQLVDRVLPDELRHRLPNPYLCAVSTALKVILTPDRSLPDAFKEELILCVAIFVRLFRPHSKVLQDPSIVEATAAAAHQWAMPAKKRGKKSDWETALAFLKKSSVRKGRT